MHRLLGLLSVLSIAINFSVGYPVFSFPGRRTVCAEPPGVRTAGAFPARIGGGWRSRSPVLPLPFFGAREGTRCGGFRQGQQCGLGSDLPDSGVAHRIELHTCSGGGLGQGEGGLFSRYLLGGKAAPDQQIATRVESEYRQRGQCFLSYFGCSGGVEENASRVWLGHERDHYVTPIRCRGLDVVHLLFGAGGKGEKGRCCN